MNEAAEDGKPKEGALEAGPDAGYRLGAPQGDGSVDGRPGTAWMADVEGGAALDTGANGRDAADKPRVAPDSEALAETGGSKAGAAAANEEAVSEGGVMRS